MNDGVDTACDAVARAMTTMLPLRLEGDRLLRRYVAGVADDGDLRRYRTARLRVLMAESVNRGVRHPRRAGEVLLHRARLDFDALVDRTDQFPEPMPS